MYMYMYIVQYDVSLPLKCMYELVDIMKERLKDKALCVLGYGHVGDGIYNVLYVCVNINVFYCTV